MRTIIFLLVFFLTQIYFSQAQTSIQSTPYFETFEFSTPTWQASGEWELGVPSSTHINSVTSGSQAWVTNLDGQYSSFSYSTLVTPYFNLSGLTLPVISFQLLFDTESGNDPFTLEYTTDGTNWSRLPNNPNLVSRNWRSNGRWTGVQHTYKKVAYSLEHLNTSQAVQFRFVLATTLFGNGDGVAIDDFYIGDFGNAELDFEAIELHSLVTACVPTNEMNVVIQNNFNHPVVINSSTTVSYQQNNGAVITEPLAINLFEARDYYVHKFQTIPTTSGEVKAWINFSLDRDNNNDTTSFYFSTSNGIDLALEKVHSLENRDTACDDSYFTIDIEVKNNYDLAFTNVPVRFQLNNELVKSELINATIPAKCSQNSLLQYRLARNVHLSKSGYNVLKVWIDHPTDVSRQNDTIKLSTYFTPSLSIPYFENFDQANLIDSNQSFQLPPEWTISKAGGWEIKSGNLDEYFGPYTTYGNQGNSLVFNGTSNLNNEDFTILSPCIEIPKDNYDYTLNCVYHFVGSGTSNFRLILKDTSNYLNAFYLSSLSSREEHYRKVSFPLQYFHKGQTVQVGFNAFGNTTNKTIVVDEISITREENNDLELRSLNNLSGKYCGLSNDTSLNVTVYNAGLTSISNFEICYQINNMQPVCQQVGGGFINPFRLEEISFDKKLDLKKSGIYNIKVYTNYSSDLNRLNDTLRTVIENTVKPIPFIDKFDDGYEDWDVETSFRGFYRWRLNSGFTPSTSTGPSVDGDSSTTGRYFYTETNFGSSFADSSFLILNKCVDPTLGNAHFVYYDYHMYGADIDKLLLQVKTGNQYITIDSLIGQQQNSFDEEWKSRNITTNFLDSQIVTFRFIGIKKSNGDKSDISIDNFGIRDTTVSLQELSVLKGKIELYPNPSKGLYTIKSTQNLIGLDYLIYDVRGQLLQTGYFSASKGYLNLSDQPNGLFFLHIPDLKVRHKLVKF